MKSYMFLVFMVVLAVSTTGCAKCTDCGRLKQSTEALSLFSSGTVSPELNYYVYQRSKTRSPLAIIGIDKKYSVKADSWKPAELTSEQLNAWVQDNKIERGQYDDMERVSIHYRGWDVLDPNGQKAGVYYSTLEWTVVKFEGDTVQVSRPQPSTMQQGLRRN